jgi:flagellar hook-associated protein 1 FlgK
MPGLLGTLNLGARSLQTQQQGVAVAGHNLANANNPAYARQVLEIQTSTPLPTSIGSVGTGADAVAITQVRDTLLDQQVQVEASITGSLQSQQTALQTAQDNLGEQLQSTSSSSDNTTNVGSPGALDSDLTSLFNAFQDLSTDPSSITSRQEVIASAQQLTSQFNQLDQRLTSINDQLNQSVQTDVTSANQLLSDIASLNQQIVGAEAGTGAANDLRDLRQQKVEALSQLITVQSSNDSNGDVNLSVGGQLLVAAGSVQDTLQAYDSGGGQLLVRTTTAGAPLTLTGGSIAGTIDARDGALNSLQDGINSLATQLISQVNTVYNPGYDLNGNTGANFLTGTNATNIGVNTTLANDPSSLQASGSAGAAGDNQVALALAQMADTSQADLGNQTFSESYNSTITALGSSLNTVNTQLTDQQSVQTMLQNERSSVSGVSIDEEMTNLITYQRAYQASAELVTTVNQMLSSLVTLGQ